MTDAIRRRCSTGRASLKWASERHNRPGFALTHLTGAQSECIQATRRLHAALSQPHITPSPAPTGHLRRSFEHNGIQLVSMCVSASWIEQPTATCCCVQAHIDVIFAITLPAKSERARRGVCGWLYGKWVSSNVAGYRAGASACDKPYCSGVAKRWILYGCRVTGAHQPSPRT